MVKAALGNFNNWKVYQWPDILLATTSGAIASFIATPTELSLIRMTSDGRLPVEQRRNYKHVFNALYRIAREEGVLTLWRVSITCDVSHSSWQSYDRGVVQQ